MSDAKHFGKFLCYVLRHRPDEVDIELDAQGWTDTEALIAACTAAGQGLTSSRLDELVSEDDKQRFEFSDDRSRIRARQGHSVPIDLGLEAVTPPTVLYQGTAARFLESIRKEGLLKQSRHHVHLSADSQTARDVGGRHGKPVVLEVRAAAMNDRGYLFYETGNGVWLTDHVPPEFIHVPDAS